MRKTINLDELNTRHQAQASGRIDVFPEEPIIGFAHVEDTELVGLDTIRNFTVEGPSFGKIACSYAPDRPHLAHWQRGF